MALSSDHRDSIELLIIKTNEKQMEQIERVYVKKSDLPLLAKAVLQSDPYYNALKYVIAAILISFVGALITLVYSSYGA